MPAVDEIFKALSDPVRIRIVEMIACNREMCVCNIVSELGMTQPAVSHHLALLKRVGLLLPRREGQWIYYSLSKSTLSELGGFIGDLLVNIEAVSQDALKCK